MTYNIHIKRVYEPVEKSDGFRVLVDGLWPRGLKKEEIHLDEWLKAIAPSAPLRKWFGHDPAKWTTFVKKYKAELETSGALETLMEYVKQHRKITLLYAARDEAHNNARALKDYLEKELKLD